MTDGPITLDLGNLRAEILIKDEQELQRNEGNSKVLFQNSIAC